MKISYLMTDKHHLLINMILNIDHLYNQFNMILAILADGLSLEFEYRMNI